MLTLAIVMYKKNFKQFLTWITN